MNCSDGTRNGHRHDRLEFFLKLFFYDKANTLFAFLFGLEAKMMTEDAYNGMLADSGIE